MSAQAPANYTEWLQNLPLPWLTAGPVGSKWATATGQLVDQYVQYMKDGVKMRYPDNAPTDALPHLGADRQLIQGSGESDTSFRTRLKDAWGQWSRAGTPCGVLEQLYYFGLTNAVWVQQNGLQYTLSGAPTPGQDPTSLVVASNEAVTSSVMTSTASPFRTIPASTPWFAFDGNTDLCNRFAIIVPSWPFAAIGTAYFNGVDNATVTWPFAFGSNVYSVIPGVPNAPVILTVDGTSLTPTTTKILASGSWTGSVTVTAYAAGVNPLNTFSAASAGALQRIISTFRPNAICMGVYAIQTGGRTWDYFPPGTTWDGGTYPQWDTNTVSQILGAF